jgi:trimethylamine---corrinoid protein Co-methyltransferase
MFVNQMPYYEILSEEALQTLDRGWKRIVTELGIEFNHPEALELFKQAGQQVEGNVVKLDPEFLLAQAALAPREFELQARSAARDLRIGGRHMAFLPVYGCPFFREGGKRRDATMHDYERLVKLNQVFPQIDMAGGVVVEPNDRPLDSRHLDMVFALMTLSDKPFMGSVISGANARDTLAMADILFGGRAQIEERPVMMSIINVNSPLRYDERMLAALLEYARAGQPVIVTPFLLMGAMSPVTSPAALVQQTAEALAGVALIELIRPGCPVVLGSFLSNIDMQSGSPMFGTPESAFGLIAGGQIARRLGLPWRAGGGGLTASQTEDAQAAYESLMTMMPAFLAGANVLMHSAGWLESGLAASFEKYVVDIEVLRMLLEAFTPVQIDEESLAFSAHEEVGHGGHFLGAAHTLERFRECFYRPLLSSSENFERWTRKGSLDAAARATNIWQDKLASYETPPMDSAIREELADFVARRRRELGD